MGRICVLYSITFNLGSNLWLPKTAGTSGWWPCCYLYLDGQQKSAYFRKSVPLIRSSCPGLIFVHRTDIFWGMSCSLRLNVIASDHMGQRIPRFYPVASSRLFELAIYIDARRWRAEGQPLRNSTQHFSLWGFPLVCRSVESSIFKTPTDGFQDLWLKIDYFHFLQQTLVTDLIELLFQAQGYHDGRLVPVKDGGNVIHDMIKELKRCLTDR